MSIELVGMFIVGAICLFFSLFVLVINSLVLMILFVWLVGVLVGMIFLGNGFEYLVVVMWVIASVSGIWSFFLIAFFGV